MAVFPDFAWKLIPGSCMELVFRNDNDMLKALELLRSMRLPTVKAVADTNEERETASQDP